MSISREDVLHIARLARIELNAAEEEKFREELSAILGFAEKLNELDTEKISPLSGGTALENVTRPDEQNEKALLQKSDKILRQAPEKKDNWFKVKAVFE